MALVRWDPFLQLSDLHTQVNSLFNDAFSGSQGSTGLLPATDVYSDDNQLTIETHLPNFAKEDISIQHNDGALEIKAEHQEKDESKGKDRKYLVRESVNSYYRRFALPKNSDLENVDANYEDGLLKVTIPYKELPKPKHISIKAGKNKQLKKS